MTCEESDTSRRNPLAQGGQPDGVLATLGADQLISTG
jgi:hypothetical protein